MNSLCPELPSHIISFLPNESLPTCASISLRFQLAIERQTFITITLKNSSLPTFITAFSLPHRRATLSSLEYQILIPDRYCCYESDGEVWEDEDEDEDDNTTFTTALVTLLTHLSTWPSTGRNINLEIKPVTGCDKSDEGTGHYLTLLPSFSIPKISRITRLEINPYRRIAGAALLQLTTFLPGLQEVEWYISDDEWKRPALREQHRTGAPPPPTSRDR
ncbi:hypothetical protein K440DRAFT_636280 [Wilcoxina mikolae CBS 423.85]|nr:hypothetical protein K440DRAFT_636280 [Wilcoxina mikolae CBS 423.85]